MASKQKARPRTYARNRTFSRKGYEKILESDGEYLLKLVLCILIASFWIKFSQPFIWMGMTFQAVPVGLVLGLIIVSQFERFQADRKIWYAILIAVGIITYFYPSGIVI
ncbi:MAG: rane protein of unknown function [Candidatus Saccharibacteria bacterium]|nr:rane protein of unknown function [Candidatus Saccharibacteria bacterium]